MSEVMVRTFPRDELEALAMLYVQNQDLGNVTPEELLDMYDNAYKALENARNKKNQASTKWF